MSGVGRRMTPNRSALPYVLLAGALALVWLAMLLLGTGHVDQAILNLLYAGDGPMLAEVARRITPFGGWYAVTPLAAVVGLIVALRGKPWLALVLVIGTYVGRLLVVLQKNEIGRLRPDQHPHLVIARDLSFPSGHSANSMMVYVTLALCLVEDPRRRKFWLAGAFGLAIMVGLSRVMLGVHWPSDVIAGWSYGLMWAMLLVWLGRRPPRWGVRR